VLFTDNSALISKDEFPNININELLAVRVGLQKGTAHTELFRRWFPEHRDTIEYDSTNDALDALSRGDVDMVMESSSTLLHLTNYQELAGYKANVVFDASFDSRVGFNKNQELLCSIMDKALALVDTETISGQWLRKTYDYRAKVAEGRMPWVIGAMILLTCVLALIIFMLFRNYKAGQIAMEMKLKEQSLAAENNMLDTLNRMKNEFFQNMSHDLKTPLTVISTDIANVDSQLDYKMDKEDVRESLANAQSEIMRMARIIDGAMKYSSMQEQREDMKLLDMAPLLREGAETYRALLERHSNSLSIDVPETLPAVYGNADALLHVLSNLLSNANRYTRGGDIAISAAAENDYVMVRVRDSGTGVKPDMLPDIFERGVSDSGTGIGLSICKSAVEAHGGEISADSEYGKGTAITITLPVYVEGQ
jgi:signal transduction histidine kinase